MKYRMILALCALLFPAMVSAQGASTPTTPTHYTAAGTDLGTLLDDPAAKAVLVKEIPTIVGDPQIDQARSMTLKGLQSYAADVLTDAKLAQIDADFAALPPKK